MANIELKEHLKREFVKNLAIASRTSGFGNCNDGIFAAVMTLVDYINAAMPFKMGEVTCVYKKHPIDKLNCSTTLKECLREAEVENLEDIESYEVCRGGIVDSVLKDIMKENLGRGLSLHRVTPSK